MIIVGATSGIGEALARVAVKNGYIVGGTGRRLKRLKALRKDLGENFHFCQMDVVRREEASDKLLALAGEMGGMDICVLNSGISSSPSSSVTAMELQVVDVNVNGFIQLFGTAFQYFKKQGKGHIVGMSSIAALLGLSRAAPYNASKAFISTYMQAYRQRCNKLKEDIAITDIKPGFVVSEMIEGKKGLFWVAETQKAAKQMLRDIEKRKSYSYVTRRWRFVAWLIKLTPNWIIDRL